MASEDFAWVCFFNLPVKPVGQYKTHVFKNRNCLFHAHFVILPTKSINPASKGFSVQKLITVTVNETKQKKYSSVPPLYAQMGNRLILFMSNNNRNKFHF